MTTIKEIEKGCESIIWSSNAYPSVQKVCGFDGDLCEVCETKLQTKKEDLEIIQFQLDNSVLLSVERRILKKLKQRIEGKQEGGE